MKFLITIILIIFTTIQVFAGPPKLIPVQGILTQIDGTLINESIDLTLSLFDAQTNGDELWKEERTDFSVKNGYISLYLGEVEEIDASVITKADELWLEVIFNGERMPRVRLASVPFALEAINAQKIGNITDTQINNMFNTACNEGYYIKGYDTEGNAICAEDKLGETQESITYNAGNGINIDDSNSISVSEDLYVAGNGIQVNNGIISVTNDVTRNPHKHDNLYYEKSNNATHNNLVKFSGNNVDGYKLEKSDILENSGEVSVSKLISNTDIEATNNIKSETGNIATISSTNATIENLNTTDLSSSTATTTTLTASTVYSNMVRANSIQIVDAQGNYTYFRGFRQIETGDIGSGSGPGYSSMLYIKSDGTLTGDENDTTILKSWESVCSLSLVQFDSMAGAADQGGCKVVPHATGKWQIYAYTNYANAHCKARCLIWNWAN